jgi:hypothetical protein
LEETYDALEGDLVGTLVQPVAARRPALRADDPGRAHRRHDLLEDGLGNGGPARELLQLEGSSALERQREDGACRVVGSSRHPHGSDLQSVRLDKQ